ncbi:hypothetical protein NE865_10755 [Phthorimaea operculella]|nr:hypothetical protein NE865_10755 [Phthorimaea operculella]
MESTSSDIGDKSKDALHCAGCTNVIPGRQFLRCFHCDSVYDLHCANVGEKRFFLMQKHQKTNWKCPECMIKERKTGNIGLLLNYSNILFDDSYSTENVTIRNHSKVGRNGEISDSPTITIEEPSLLDLPNEENYNYSDYLRSIIREELREHSLVDFLANSIAKVVAEQTYTRMHDTIQTLTNEVSKLQTKLSAMETLLHEKEQTNTKLREELSQGSSGNATNIPSQVPDSPSIIQQEVTRLAGTSTNDNTPKKNKNNSHKKNKAKNKQNNSMPVIPASPSQVQNIQIPVLNPQVVTGAVGDSEYDAADGTSDGSEWIEVTRQRQRKVPPAKTNILHGSAAPGTTSLQASERIPYLHLCFVKEGTTVDQIKSHLNKICAHDQCTVVELRARGNYASFKLGVPKNSLENVLSPESWPENICIKPWQQFFRGQKNKPKEKPECEKK